MTAATRLNPVFPSNCYSDPYFANSLQLIFVQPTCRSTAACRVKDTNMKRLIALAVVIFASQAVATFGGEPVGSSTQVVAPLPGFFRSNEFDIGAFGTYATGLGSGANAGKLHAWGEARIPLYGSPGNMQVCGSKGTGATTRCS